MVVLTTRGALSDAFWALASVLATSVPDYGGQIWVDGDAPDRIPEPIAALAPSLACFNLRSQFHREADEWWQRFATSYRLAHKAWLLMRCQSEVNTLYLDSDVLFFSEPWELWQAIEAQKPCHLQDVSNCYDPVLARHLEDIGFSLLPGVNSGLLYLPRDESDFWKAVTAAPLVLQDGSWFAEQTLVAAWLRQLGAVALPAERYVVSNRRQFWPDADVDYRLISARHFTGPVRHLMYRRGVRVLREILS